MLDPDYEDIIEDPVDPEPEPEPEPGPTPDPEPTPDNPFQIPFTGLTCDDCSGSCMGCSGTCKYSYN